MCTYMHIRPPYNSMYACMRISVHTYVCTCVVGTLFCTCICMSHNVVILACLYLLYTSSEISVLNCVKVMGVICCMLCVTG